MSSHIYFFIKKKGQAIRGKPSTLISFFWSSQNCMTIVTTSAIQQQSFKLWPSLSFSAISRHNTYNKCSSHPPLIPWSFLLSHMSKTLRACFSLSHGRSSQKNIFFPGDRHKMQHYPLKIKVNINHKIICKHKQTEKRMKKHQKMFRLHLTLYSYSCTSQHLKTQGHTCAPKQRHMRGFLIRFLNYLN